MHDFHLADQIYRVIKEYAEKNQLRTVKRAVIELGSIVEHGEEILPENLAFNLKMLAQGGPAAGLEVVIKKAAGADWILREIEGE